MSQPEHGSTVTTGVQPKISRQRPPKIGQGSKFFQHMQPTFTVELPATTNNLQFIDVNDPAKSTIVRRKAREWVNKNKDATNRTRQKKLRSASEDVTGKGREKEWSGEVIQLPRKHSRDAIVIPLNGGLRQFDPFNIFPDVGRKYDHIVEFFLKGCPEEIPCSDDKYADDSSKSLLDFSRENTVLGNMARSRVTFMLWLYATVTIRDGMKGSVHTEEVQWFYNKALKLMQETLKKEAEAGQYSDHLLNALSCITAAASFAGMFNTAVLHRDATIRVLRIRGDGDVLKGLQSAPAWTSKALQWCEMMVATQLAETPQMPYYHATTSKPLPDNVVYEAEQLTAATLSNLPCVSEPIQYIIRLLHQIGVAYAKRTAGTKVDSYIIEPLYDALYALLQMQEAHKKTGILSDAEHLLVETFQLYFWTGVRLLPPATRLCDLLVSRVMKALLPLLLNTLPEEAENFCQTARGYAVDTSIDEERVLKTLNHPSTTNNLIAWSLALGTVATMPLNRPEYMWFKGHFQSYLQAMGLDQDEEGYYALLKMFPTTDGLGWIGLKKLFGTLQT